MGKCNPSFHSPRRVRSRLPSRVAAAALAGLVLSLLPWAAAAPARATDMRPLTMQPWTMQPLTPRDAQRLEKWRGIFGMNREERAKRLVPRRPQTDHLSPNSLADPAYPKRPPAMEQAPEPYYPAE